MSSDETQELLFFPDLGQLATRFWSKVHKTRTCWLWQAWVSDKGYGLFRVGRRGSWVASRTAWLLTHGDIPGDLCVLHRCDNPPCVNPAHLFLGTPADNSADRDAKGRQRPLHGEENGCAILRREQVIVIRQSDEPVKTLARRFGVSSAAVYDVLEGRSWRRVWS